ncbi:ATP-binding cassette domain-containing protein [Erysipelothrix sp. HDW6C]|uniref:ATP-binding cassette domain-containing protein n=1 Tax=Erysipelothrix sp. HDW6C TaxID=2714930 RepID=UPI00140C8349|nr:ATP-binding cassette domain-containing protein [Erysipelothrix sp. HDW6C]QIK70076.1 ATP-binding cassette domain-containing protein [Erysipelothrix sp. HDW6C]
MVITFDTVSKSFGDKLVLNNLTLNIKRNSFTVISGPSGTGKSTILNLMGLLDAPDSGTITILDEHDIKPFSRSATLALRNKIGYLFQNFALVDDKTVAYNLKLAMESVKGVDKEEAIRAALETVGMSGFETQKVYQCSGGEQQRIAIARLLLKPCEIVLADEPTGSLDDDNKHIIFSLLKKLQEMGKTLIVVTHDPELVAIADHVIHL